jgi:hypothetical protein
LCAIVISFSLYWHGLGMCYVKTSQYAMKIKRGWDEWGELGWQSIKCCHQQNQLEKGNQEQKLTCKKVDLKPRKLTWCWWKKSLIQSLCFWKKVESIVEPFIFAIVNNMVVYEFLGTNGLHLGRLKNVITTLTQYNHSLCDENFHYK